jgi:hypothetical protein
MENQIIENAGLIRTLPEDVASKVTRDIAENALKGKRAKSIESIIRGQTSKHSRASARLNKTSKLGVFSPLSISPKYVTAISAFSARTS